jgi:hypothetical protein
MKRKVFILGTVFGFILAGCTGAIFPYQYYYLELKDYIGVLKGETASDDLDVKVCTPDSQGNHQCVVFKKDVAQAMVLDYMSCQDQLIRCQRSCKP